VLVDAETVGFKLVPEEARDLCAVGQLIKTAAAEQLSAVHPLNPEFPGITQTEFTTPVSRVDGMLTARNAVIVSPGRIDRSPCGTGTSARLAVMYARGQVDVGEHFRHRSIIDTSFDAVVERTTTVASTAAVVPSVAGQAWITDLSKVGVNPTDPFPNGFTLSDTWMGADRRP
jgi:proline racemase